MWVEIPQQHDRGPHHVFVPKEFGRNRETFPSDAEFLKALRVFHERNEQPQLRLL